MFKSPLKDSENQLTETEENSVNSHLINTEEAVCNEV